MWRAGAAVDPQWVLLTRVTGQGGLLSDEIVSLLVGINNSRHATLLDLIGRCCHTRIKYVQHRQFSLPGQPLMIEAEVGARSFTPVKLSSSFNIKDRTP